MESERLKRFFFEILKTEQTLRLVNEGKSNKL